MLQNAPTQSLLSVVNGILEESVERRNGEIPYVWPCRLWFWCCMYKSIQMAYVAQTHVAHTVS